MKFPAPEGLRAIWGANLKELVNEVRGSKTFRHRGGNVGPSGAREVFT